MNIREYREASWKFDKFPVGASNGFARFVVFTTEHRYVHGKTMTSPPSEYIDRDLGLGVSLAIEKDDIWVCWKPGWGVDIHYPADRCPEYLRSGDPHDCMLNGKCRTDGSSLADGEHFQPAFNRGGAEAVFLVLEGWWCNSDGERESSEKQVS